MGMTRSSVIHRKARMGRLALTALLTLATPTTVIAQSGLPGGASTLSKTHGEWQVNCAVSGELTRCSLSQTQVTGHDRQRLLAIELVAADGGSAVYGTLLLPFGLRIEDGVSISIDDNPVPPSLRFSTCLPAGCIVPLAFDKTTIDRMKGSTKLSFAAMANEGGQEVSLSVSLSGITSGLARIVELNRVP